MREIVARDQVRLGVTRCWQLALNGMSHRMFRSSITIAILALAVAFLSHMLGFGILERETQGSAYSEIESSRALGQVITRLVTVDSPAEIAGELVAGSAARTKEYATWSGDAGLVERARKIAGRFAAAASYLDALPPASRAVVLGDAKAPELLERTSTLDTGKVLIEKLRSLGHHAPVGNDAEFLDLLVTGRQEFAAAVERIRAGQKAALEAVAQAFPGRLAADLAASPPSDFAAVTQSAGFVIPDIGKLADFARRAKDLSVIERTLLVSETRSQIARDSGIATGEIGFKTVLDYVGSDSARAKWLATALRAGGASGALSGPRIHDLFVQYARERDLEQASLGFVPNTGGFFGLAERSQWLILLSFLVCVVGVANAMLMSVTERFTEIATMKCLGAMDGFVMMMFVFEAVIQGAVGGVVGVLLGALLAAMRAGFEYGSLASSGFGALGELGLASLLSLVVGVLLAAFAAVGPSFVAARLAPMEAMRVD